MLWRGRRELITDVRKPGNHGYDVDGSETESYLLITPITLANLSR